MIPVSACLYCGVHRAALLEVAVPLHIPGTGVQIGFRLEREIRVIHCVPSCGVRIRWVPDDSPEVAGCVCHVKVD